MAPRTYRLSPLADSDMEDIWRYSITRWSEARAESYTRELLSAFADLATGNRAGTPTTARKGYLRLWVGTHAVFYRVRPTRIEIIRVLHQARHFPRHL